MKKDQASKKPRQPMNKLAFQSLKYYKQITQSKRRLSCRKDNHQHFEPERDPFEVRLERQRQLIDKQIDHCVNQHLYGLGCDVDE